MMNHCPLCDDNGSNLRSHNSKSTRTICLLRILYVTLVPYCYFTHEQIQVIFTEDLLMHTLGTLGDVQHFLGVPWFDFAPFLVRNNKGHLVPSFSASKATAATHLPVPSSAHTALLRLYAPHNARLAKLLGDDRVYRLWNSPRPV